MPRPWHLRRGGTVVAEGDAASIAQEIVRRLEDGERVDVDHDTYLALVDELLSAEQGALVEQLDYAVAAAYPDGPPVLGPDYLDPAPFRVEPAPGEDQVASAAEQDRQRRGEPPPGKPENRVGEPASGRDGGDPVDLFSGQVHHVYLDLVVQTALQPLEFRRTYRSGVRRHAPLGFNWDHNWHVYLRELTSGIVARWTGELYEEHFRPLGAGYEPPRGRPEVLERIEGGFLVRGPRRVEARFLRPEGWSDTDRIPLVEIRDASGYIIALEYDAEGRVASVRDSDDRGFDFTYGSCGFLEKLADHTGRACVYYHDTSAEFLVEARTPPVPGYDLGVRTRYEYDYGARDIRQTANITRIVDHDGMVLAETFYVDDPQ